MNQEHAVIGSKVLRKHTKAPKTAYLHGQIWDIVKMVLIRVYELILIMDLGKSERGDRNIPY